ncbi:SlyX family protein [Alteromonas oceanisediminis]|uniref:SlyX family protein n=1 Tax=Alteromonas oceanisediminis TaxID=2836180 RepID=UPI001BD9F969|nr:SlyX family protein [Alteromonas oceanisediminis]MBT0586201.1 SlyX family protein [Alteromonas oceanisediminis]
MSNNDPLQTQIDELQNKLAFQEHTIDSLNLALSDQQNQISQLQRITKMLTDKVKSLQTSNIATASEEAPPPHY